MKKFNVLEEFGKNKLTFNAASMLSPEENEEAQEECEELISTINNANPRDIKNAALRAAVVLPGVKKGLQKMQLVVEELAIGKIQAENKYNQVSAEYANYKLETEKENPEVAQKLARMTEFNSQIVTSNVTHNREDVLRQIKDAITSIDKRNK
jgi:hypothetical protein